MHGNVVSEYCSRKWRKALRPQPWILCGNGGIPVPCPREKREAAEALLIGPHGLLSTQSTGRPTPEPPCEMRTCFQRDVDRITHSKSFRRLKHKTQVFLRPEVLGNLLFLGVGCSMAAYLLWTWVLGHLGAVKTNNYLYVQPICTMIIAAILFGKNDPITLTGCVGALLIIGGLYLGDYMTRRDAMRD